MLLPETETFSGGDPMVMTSELSSRYGRTRKHRLRGSWLVGGFVALFIVIFGIWALWAGYGNTQSTLGETDIGSSIDNTAHTATVRFAVSVNPGTRYSCAAAAEDINHSIVGWKVFSYGPFNQRQTTHAETIRTIQSAVQGLIYECWLS